MAEALQERDVMAVALIAGCTAVSKTDVKYGVELRLERHDGEPAWIVELITTPPNKPAHSTVRWHPSKELARAEYDKFQSLLTAIDNQRLGVEAGGQITMKL